MIEKVKLPGKSGEWIEEEMWRENTAIYRRVPSPLPMPPIKIAMGVTFEFQDRTFIGAVTHLGPNNRAEITNSMGTTYYPDSSQYLELWSNGNSIWKRG